MRPYESLVRKLYKINLFHPAKLGLSNIQRLHKALGSPVDGIPSVHVAGTNGKGSVAFKMARSLELGGLRTGLFVSPHVCCFRERMQVNGELISEDRVEQLLPMIFDVCESHGIPATFFEITTALAFQHFRDAEVEAVVVEAGLGGRLDATNIITPVLSVITSIGLDHTNVLGNTVEMIAAEKAGIFKPGAIALVGENCPTKLLKGIAETQGSKFYHWSDVFPEGPLPTAVDYDEENSRLAEAGLRLLAKANPHLQVNEVALREGLKIRPWCRFEVLNVDSRKSRGPKSCAPGDSPGADGVTVVLDVAHNAPAIKSLFEKINREFPERRCRIVAAFSGDKNALFCMSAMLDQAGHDRIHICEASTPRAQPAAKLAAALEEVSGGKFGPSRWVREGDDSVRRAVRDAIDQAALSGGEGMEKEVVLVCGSIFMMVDAREEIGFDEPKDSFAVASASGAAFRASQDAFSDAMASEADRTG